jgi:hypothetical protein
VRSKKRTVNWNMSSKKSFLQPTITQSSDGRISFSIMRFKNIDVRIYFMLART